MKAKFLLLFFLTFTFIHAISIEELITATNENNYTIQGLEKAILGAQENIVLAKKWQNPILNFGINDIQFQDVTKRDLEPIQAQYIGITQVIPMGKKLKYKEEIASKDKEILNLILEDKKLEFQAKIYELYYSIAVLEEKYELFNKYLKNIKSIEKLNIALYEDNQVLQTQALTSTILYSKMQLQQLKLENTIKNLYLKLEELTQEKIDKIEINTTNILEHLHINCKNHPKLQAQELLSSKAIIQAQLEEENKIPDISLSVAYFQRDSKYENYVNFSIGIPLALYGTEKSKVLQSKSKSYEEHSRLSDLEKQFCSQTKQLHNDFETSKKNLAILEKSILPTQQKIQESLELYNSLDKVKPQELILALNDYLEYELLVLDERLVYFQTIAKVAYYNKGKNQ